MEKLEKTKKVERTGKNSTASNVITTVIVILVIFFLSLASYNIGSARGKKAATPSPAGAPAAARGGAAPSSTSSGANNAARSGGGASTASRASVPVRVTPVKTGSIDNSIVINGDVLATGQVSIFPAVAGKVSSLRLRVGDSVQKGDVVAYVDPSRPGDYYALSPVVSTISGTVLQSPFSSGDTVSTNSAIFVVGDLSSIYVETYVPERFAASVAAGLAAEVSFQAIPGAVFAARVSEMSPVLDPQSRTLRIRLRFNNRDARIRAGMFATVSLVTESRRGVPVIPRAAVINTYGNWIVFVVTQDNVAVRREITLGLESEEEIEILSGVSPGDLVVSAGQNFLSDGELVRIVD